MLTLHDFKNKLSSSANVKWKQNYSLEQFWCFEMKSSSEEVWPYIADTSAFNQEIGLTARDQKEIDGKILVTTTMAGFEQIWIEEPWTWVYGQTINSERIYKKT